MAFHAVDDWHDWAGVADAQDRYRQAAGVLADITHAVVAAFIEDAIDVRDFADQTRVDDSGYQPLRRRAVIVLGDLQFDLMAAGRFDHEICEAQSRRDWRLDKDVDAVLHQEDGNRVVRIARNYN